MGTGIRWASIVAVLGVAACALGAGPFELRVRSVWVSLGPGKHRFPFLVTVRNNTSQDAVGRLVIESDQGTDVVPLEVARQSQKEVPVYPLLATPPMRVVFESRAGSVMAKVPYNDIYANRRLGMIGDSSGDLSFLRMRRQADGTLVFDETVNVGYCLPEDAPDRPVGFFPLDAVFLGEGSDRLNTRQVEALKQYALQGGRIVIPGGANVPELSAAAWRNVLPVRDAAPKTFSQGISLTMSTKAKVGVRESITLMLGKPDPTALVAGTLDGQPTCIVRPVGLGSIVFLGYDPFADPMVSHPNRRQLVLDAMKVAAYGSATYAAQQVTLMSGNEYDSSGYSPYSGSEYPPSLGAESMYAHKNRFDSKSLANSPFDVRLIPTDTVKWIFVWFFLAVIPINFLLLRLLKRLEWAWATTPLLCFFFAGILLSESKGLYSSKLSKAYEGFVVQDLDAGLNAQWLRASYFMPQGGSYDLTLPDTDEVLPGDHFNGDDYSYRYRSYEQDTFQIPVVDAGSATVPRVDVPNLAFRELTYHRIGTPPLQIVMNLRNKNGSLEGTVVNKSPYMLYRVSVVVKERTYVLPDLASGKSVAVTRLTPRMTSTTSRFTSGRAGGQAVLYALMRDFDPGGPGQLAASSTKVLLVCTKEVGPSP